MKINSKFTIREIAGDTIIVNQGKANVNMTCVISLNDSARLLFEQLSNIDFELEDAANILVLKYGIDKDKAIHDAGLWVNALKNCRVIE